MGYIVSRTAFAVAQVGVVHRIGKKRNDPVLRGVLGWPMVLISQSPNGPLCVGRRVSIYLL
jgi:hypothetical protein